MTKAEAKAILACRKAVLKALDTCQAKLEKGRFAEGEQPFMEHYWGASIRATINGHGYGAAPISKAEETLT